jgi:glutaminyl-tRNA synthetase
MRAGEFPDGALVLRAKIDMASPNMNMRDPTLYRIRRATHHRTGDAWCIYPMYDYAHPLSDALEHITHSLCTLEFEDHRPLHDWCVETPSLTGDRPRQIEFTRLNLNYTVMSKRRLRNSCSGGTSPAGTIRACCHPGCGAAATPESVRDFARASASPKCHRRRAART